MSVKETNHSELLRRAKMVAKERAGLIENLLWSKRRG